MLHLKEIFPGEFRVFFIQYGCTRGNSFLEALTLAYSLIDEVAYAVDAFFS